MIHSPIASPIAGFIAPASRQRFPLAKVVCQLLEAYGVDLDHDIVVDLQLEIRNDPWMPLSIVVEAEQVTLAHLRDDGVLDPGALLVADGQGKLTVQGFQLAIRPYKFVPGRDPQFEQVWARNIRTQGFVGAARAVGEEHRA